MLLIRNRNPKSFHLISKKRRFFFYKYCSCRLFKIILHLLLCTFIGRQDISQLLSLTKAKPEPRPGVNNWYQSKNKETKEEEDGMAHTDEEVNVNSLWFTLIRPIL